MTTFEIAKKEADKFISDGIPFSYEELCVSIISKGGVLRISTYVNLREYLDYYIYKRELFYNEYTDKFDSLPDKKTQRKIKLKKLNNLEK